MGLGFEVSAVAPRRGFLRLRPRMARVWREIVDAISDCTADDVLPRLLKVEKDQRSLWVSMCPGAESLQFTWGGGGRVTASAKTSTTGPGFHAYCVRLIERVGERCCLAWNWPGEDETGYAEHRDFAKLQAEMASFLKTLWRMVLEHTREGGPTMALNWPLNSPIPCEGDFSVAPGGSWSKQWWEGVRDAEGVALDARAREFYAWWNEEQDAEFFRKAGATLLWSRVAWRPPADDEERETCQLALDLFSQAKTLDPAGVTYETELQELRELLAQSPADAAPPRRDGVGFHRRMMTCDATGRWTIALPGYFRQQLEDNATTVNFWHGDRAVYVSSISWKRGDKCSADSLDDVEAGDGVEVVERRDAPFKGKATLSQVTEDGRMFWSLQGTVRVDHTLCIVYVSYSQPDHRQWAIDTYQSIRHPAAMA